ncbi:hypothetical protein GCM10017044_14360 [Kordiimonas sediminis]|uniref:GAF domain-containing protein n=1 Tax=Kordiimonas sediminis TaxID=1735581 RepID=A0A919E587_9PROT|nr:GAF domain-containing protein [Kordiimonas sediminis]GHF20597.1 hypothetical protein GCM10017044_14360 [Kordiimonas sediminis]
MQQTRQYIETLAANTVPGPMLLQSICKDAATNLQVDLVSVWFFSETYDRITCACRYDVLADTVTSGGTLGRAAHPVYFQHLLSETRLIAPDVEKRSYTVELLDTYFRPNKIKSLLDYILVHNSEPIGVICCENRRTTRDWREEDVRYLNMLGTMAAAALFQSRSEFL